MPGHRADDGALHPPLSRLEVKTLADDEWAPKSVDLETAMSEATQFLVRRRGAVSADIIATAIAIAFKIALLLPLDSVAMPPNSSWIFSNAVLIGQNVVHCNNWQIRCS